MDELPNRWFFDGFAPFYDRLMAEPDAAAIEAGLRAAERPVDQVVDVGGGTGRALRGLEVSSTVVLDASRGMLASAADNGYPAVQGDAAMLPLADRSADAVLLVDAVHMLGAVDEALAEAARVLRPGGAVVVREVDPSTTTGRALRVVERLVGLQSTLLTPEEVTARMEAVGLAPTVPVPEWKYTVAGVAVDGNAND